MENAFSEDVLVEKLKELRLENEGLYVYGQQQPSGLTAALLGPFAFIFSPIKPYILNFSKAGFAMLEIRGNKFTGMHSYTAVEKIVDISFKKGILDSTLLIKKEGDKKPAKIKIMHILPAASWQKPNIEKLEEFLKTFGKE